MADQQDNDTNQTIQEAIEPDVSYSELLLNQSYSGCADGAGVTKDLGRRRIKPVLQLIARLTSVSSISSYCTSIASEIRNGRVENGRVYASYGQNGTEEPITL